MKETIKRSVELSAGVSAHVNGAIVNIKGPKGEVQREFVHPKVKITLEENKIVLVAEKGTKREKTIIGAFRSHIRNMVQGVKELHLYKLKVCSGHFPMTVTVSGHEFIIKNFLGEAVARKAQIVPGVIVKVEGNDVTVTSADLEAAGLTAARIENLCRITNRDKRIFQDGCYIVQKPGQNL
ncbi:MAG: 50S ribosomal protein L6 [Nanoarchaeota archaeon]